MASVLETASDVLVIDDDINGNQVLCDHLRFRGYAASSARSGQEALTQLEELSDEKLPRLIFLDVLMPGMSGCQVLQALREKPRTAKIPVVLLSVLSQEEIHEQATCERSDVSGYVSKPFEMATVLKKLEDVLR